MILVTFLFLQSLRATLVPLVAIPVSLVGTFAGMQLLGFSINFLTPFGLVLAIGIVVNDAIKVVENVERVLAAGDLSPRDATVKAMKEITGPIVASVLVLAAVFLPVAFLGGLTGEIYRQFAVTVAVSVAISGRSSRGRRGRSPQSRSGRKGRATRRAAIMLTQACVVHSIGPSKTDRRGHAPPHPTGAASHTGRPRPRRTVSRRRSAGARS